MKTPGDLRDFSIFVWMVDIVCSHLKSVLPVHLILSHMISKSAPLFNGLRITLEDLQRFTDNY